MIAQPELTLYKAVEYGPRLIMVTDNVWEQTTGDDYYFACLLIAISWRGCYLFLL